MQLAAEEDKVEIISEDNDGPPQKEEIKDSENSIVLTEKNGEINPEDEVRVREEDLILTERQILLSPDSHQPIKTIDLNYVPPNISEVIQVKQNADDLKHFEEGDENEYQQVKDQVILESEKQIEDATNQIKTDTVAPYDQILDQKSKASALLVSAVDPEILEEEERKLKEQKLIRMQQEAEAYETKRLNLMSSMEEGKVSLYGNHIEMSENLEKKEIESIKKVFEQRQLVALTYKKAESSLQHKIRVKDGEIITDYSGLRNLNKISQKVDITNDARKREYTTFWTRAPQPLVIHIHMLRAIKDKVASGVDFQYTILVSILDRIGGNVLEYQRTNYNTKLHVKRLTKNKKFRCSYDSTELRFEDSIKLVAPCKDDVRSSMVILFELFRINSKESKLDKVDGWGVFPLLNARFDINEGKYRIPILAGAVDRNIDQYRALERKMINNLDKWLCNMYFEVVKIGNAYTRFCIELNLKVFK